MTVTVVSEFDPKEHYRVARVVTRHTAARWISWVFVALALVMVAWSVLPYWGEADPVTLFASAAPWLFLCVFWIGLIPLSQRFSARKLPKRDASARGSQERTLDESGFHFRGNGVSLDVPWHAMARGIETGEFFLLFYNKSCAYYLAKRRMTAEQISDARQLMKAGLGATARTM